MTSNSDRSLELETLILCRCEGITLGSLRAAIREKGSRSINDAKKVTRAGMGLCQGKTCALLIERALAAEAGILPGTEPYRARPPIRAIALAALAASADQFAVPTGSVSAAVLWGRTSGTATLTLDAGEDE